MNDKNSLKNLQKEVAEDFCEPFRGEQKEECVNYYEKWIDKEEEQKQADEQK